jgi:hypothetical protein
MRRKIPLEILAAGATSASAHIKTDVYGHKEDSKSSPLLSSFSLKTCPLRL